MQRQANALRLGATTTALRKKQARLPQQRVIAFTLDLMSISFQRVLYTDFTCLSGVAAALALNALLSVGLVLLQTSRWHYGWRLARRAERARSRGAPPPEEEGYAAAREEVLCDHFYSKVAEFVSIAIVSVLLLTESAPFEVLWPAQRSAVLTYILIMGAFETLGLLAVRVYARVRLGTDAFRAGVRVLLLNGKDGKDGKDGTDGKDGGDATHKEGKAGPGRIMCVLVLSAVHVSQDVVLAQVDVAGMAAAASDAEAQALRDLVVYFGFACASVLVVSAYAALGQKVSANQAFRI